MDYKLSITFENLAEMENFVREMNKKGKQSKREGEKRGKHMVELHQKAKEYQRENPDIPYKDCLKRNKSNECI